MSDRVNGVNQERRAPSPAPRTWTRKAELLRFIEHAAGELRVNPGAYLTLVLVSESRAERTVARLAGPKKPREVQRWLGQSAPRAAGDGDEVRFRLRLWRSKGMPAGSRSFRLRSSSAEKRRRPNGYGGESAEVNELRTGLGTLEDTLSRQLGSIRSDLEVFAAKMDQRESHDTVVEERLLALQDQIDTLCEVVHGFVSLLDL